MTQEPLSALEKRVLAGRDAKIPDDVLRAIKTPHEHECDGSPPLWIIWRDRNDGDGPQIDSICDSSVSAITHADMVLESPSSTVAVERIPANHRFASSIQYEILKAKAEAKGLSFLAGRYRRQGD